MAALDKQIEAFTDHVVFMDPDMVVFMTGCPKAMAKKVAFRAWMMVMTDIIQNGNAALEKFATPDDVMEAYAKAYTPEFFAKRDKVRAAMAEDGLAPGKSADEADVDGEPGTLNVSSMEHASRAPGAGAA
jgi:exopolysaccharide biosynthesis predicted pyruvyltransferase EpsI